MRSGSRAAIGASVLAVVAAAGTSVVTWLPWVTFGGHPWTLRRIVRDGALLGVLGGVRLLLVVVLLALLPLGAAIAGASALRRRAKWTAVGALSSSCASLLLGVTGTVLGDGPGPVAAVLLGLLGVSASATLLVSARPSGRTEPPSGAVGVGVGRLGTPVGAAIAALGLLPVAVLLRGPSHDSPDQAMRAVIRAVDRRDPVALAELTAPEERAVLLDDGIPLLRRLRSIGLLRISTDLRTVGARDALLEDVETQVTPLGEGLAAVRLRRATVVPAAAPRSLLVLTWWTRARAAALGGAPVFPPGWDRPVARLDADPEVPPLVFERHHGHWYLSIVRTLLRASGVTDGSGDDALRTASGAGSPGEAVERLADALASLDVTAAAEVLAPGEVGAIVGDATAMARLRALVAPVAREYSLVLPGLETAVRRRGATAWVRVVRTGFDLRTTATDAPPFRMRYDLDTGCTTMTLDLDVRTRCGRDAWGLLDELGIPVDERDARLLIGERVPSEPDLAVVVVRRGGRWFVSPARTLLRSLTIRLAGADRRDTDAALRSIRDVLGALQP